MSEKLEFGNTKQIKSIKKEQREAEQRDKWSKMKARAVQAAKKIASSARLIGRASFYGSINCGGCLRLDCEWHQDSADHAPNGVLLHEPHLDCDVQYDEVVVTCCDCLVKP